MDAKNNAVLKEAKKKISEGNGGNGSGYELPDLTELAVEEKLTDLQHDIEEAAKKDEWCRNAAKLIPDIRKRINEISIVAHHGPLSPQLSKELKELKAKEAKILGAGDENIRNHLLFSVGLEEIRTAPRTKDIAEVILARVIETGRYSLLSKKEAEIRRKEWRSAGSKAPHGVQFFCGNIYEPFIPAEGDEKSQGQKAVESVLSQYLKEVKKEMDKVEKTKMASVESAGGETDLDKLNKGIPGIYLWKAVGEKKGALRVEIYEREIGESKVKFISVLGAGGCFNNLNSAIGNLFISYALFKKGQALPFKYLNTGDVSLVGNLTDIAILFKEMLEKIPEEKREMVKKIVITLKKIVRESYSQ